jgi:hypothetical protein
MEDLTRLNNIQKQTYENLALEDYNRRPYEKYIINDIYGHKIHTTPLIPIVPNSMSPQIMLPGTTNPLTTIYNPPLSQDPIRANEPLNYSPIIKRPNYENFRFKEKKKKKDFISPQIKEEQNVVYKKPEENENWRTVNVIDDQIKFKDQSTPLRKPELKDKTIINTNRKAYSDEIIDPNGEHSEASNESEINTKTNSTTIQFDDLKSPQILNTEENEQNMLSSIYKKEGSNSNNMKSVEYYNDNIDRNIKIRPNFDQFSQFDLPPNLLLNNPFLLSFLKHKKLHFTHDQWICAEEELAKVLSYFCEEEVSQSYQKYCKLIFENFSKFIESFLLQNNDIETCQQIEVCPLITAK